MYVYVHVHVCKYDLNVTLALMSEGYILSAKACDIAFLSELRLSQHCADFPNSIHEQFYAYPSTEDANFETICCGPGGLIFLVNKDLCYAVDTVDTSRSNHIIGLYIHRGNSTPLYLFGVYMPSDSNINQ